jgi:hypothetical protein
MIFRLNNGLTGRQVGFLPISHKRALTVIWPRDAERCGCVAAALTRIRDQLGLPRAVG